MDDDLSSHNMLKSSTKNTAESKFMMDDIRKAMATIPSLPHSISTIF